MDSDVTQAQATFDKDEMHRVQPPKHETSHQASLTSAKGPSLNAPAPRNARPEPRREDSSSRQSTIPGQAVRSRSPVSRKRVPVDSITANLEVDAPGLNLYNGQQGQESFVEAPQEPVTKQFDRYPEHVEVQRQAPFGGSQTFLGNSRRNLVADDSLGLADSHSYPPTDNEMPDYLQRRAASPEPIAPFSYQQDTFTSPNDPYDGAAYYHEVRDAKRSKTSVPPREGRGEKRRATSPLPIHDRPESPSPASPATYPKALPENPGQLHLTAQAKRLAAGEVRSCHLSLRIFKLTMILF